MHKTQSGFTPIHIILSILAGTVVLGGIVGGVLYFSKSTVQQQGKCGDGACGTVEKANPNLCPKDCAGEQPVPSATSTTTPKTENQETRQTADIRVDYLKEIETISPYIFGTLASPYFDKNGFSLVKEGGFRMIEINMPVKMPSDPEDSSQYDFSKLDQQVSTAMNYGMEPLIWFNSDRVKPSDLKKFATFSKNVAKHLTQGWGDGRNWDIKLFRFGNEPDNAAFWKGTQNDYFEYYATWAKALKKVDESFVLAAPGVMDAKKGNDINPWIASFLKYAKDNNAPIDIFSFHAYSPFPESFYDSAVAVNKELDKYPNLSPLFGRPKLGNDEWNLIVGDVWSGSYHKEFDTAWVAADNISSLINMIEQGLYLSVRYGGAFNGGSGGCHDFPITDCNGKGKPTYYAFKGFNWLSGKTIIKTEGSDRTNMTAISGKGIDEIIIVLSNYDAKGYTDKYGNEKTKNLYDIILSKKSELKTYNKFELNLKNLPWTSTQNIVYERYVVDDDHALELAESQTFTGAKEMKFTEDISAPSVQIIKLYKK